MTRDNARDYLPLVQALAEGKVIQYNYNHPNPPYPETWCDRENLDFNIPPNYYRIKPEPRVWWVNEYGPEHFGELHTTLEKAKTNSGNAVLRTIKVVEVLE